MAYRVMAIVMSRWDRAARWHLGVGDAVGGGVGDAVGDALLPVWRVRAGARVRVSALGYVTSIWRAKANE